MQSSIQFMHDIFNGTVIKSIVFALICTWIAVYQGYACVPTSEGIATSTTRTVVLEVPSDRPRATTRELTTHSRSCRQLGR